MNERTAKLRRASLDAAPSISPERASLMTDFYQANEGKYSVPVMRARSFYYLCEHKTIYLGDDELIVGERGPAPKAVPTYPELTCHSLEDLRILDSRPKTSYAVSEECIQIYEEKIIPYWRSRSMRDKIFAAMTEEWHAAYNAGIFTEFMEQRRPGHTVLDDKIYRRGMLDFKRADRRNDRRAGFPGRYGGLRQAGAAQGNGHRLRRGDTFRLAPCKTGGGNGRYRRPIRSAKPNWKKSPMSARTCRPMRRAIFTRPCNTTGSAIWR